MYSICKKSFSHQRRKQLESLFNGDNVQFTLGVVNLDGFPPQDIPEICFAGRSNVGKSSLINAITNRRNLARASNTPGRTQELNYFSVGGLLNIVDLPGYGFAEAPVKKVAIWNELIRNYLKGRTQLKRAFVLVDARHGIKKIDEEIFTIMDQAGVNYQIILTKSDKISDSALGKVQEQVIKKADQFVALHPDILVTSSEKRLGIIDVQHQIANFIPEYFNYE